MRKFITKKALTIGMGLFIIGLTTAGTVSALSRTTTTQQLVKTMAITVTYQDIANGIDESGNSKTDMWSTIGQLPANTEVISSYFKVATPFKDSNDSQMQPYGTLSIQTDNTSVNVDLSSGDLTQTGLQHNDYVAHSYMYNTDNDIKLKTSIAAGVDNLGQLTSGKATFYINYLVH
jgi:hypothetical protein